jgi:hypothetical protein
LYVSNNFISKVFRDETETNEGHRVAIQKGIKIDINQNNELPLEKRISSYIDKLKCEGYHTKFVGYSKYTLIYYPLTKNFHLSLLSGIKFNVSDSTFTFHLQNN